MALYTHRQPPLPLRSRDSGHADSYDMGEDCTRDLDFQQLICHSLCGFGPNRWRLESLTATMRFPFDLAALAVFIPPFARRRNPFITPQCRHSLQFLLICSSSSIFFKTHACSIEFHSIGPFKWQQVDVFCTFMGVWVCVGGGIFSVSF